MSGQTDKVKVEKLKRLRREELAEILLGEERLLSNPTLMKSLPDKGQKIIKYIEQLRLAIQYWDDEERRLSAARAELKSEQEQSVSRGPAAVTTETAADAAVTMETAADAAAASDDSDLVRSLGTMSVSDIDPDVWGDTVPRQTTHIPEENYFFKTHEKKKPHCLNVLEQIENTNPARKQKFRTNQFPQREDASRQERRAEERRRLEELSAATLAPPQHGGAVLLSLEESASLLQEQTRRRRELEAKVAAQKLSGGLQISMQTYSPDDSSVASYRQVQGEEDHGSSDED